jgi:hypothetical protein
LAAKERDTVSIEQPRPTTMPTRPGDIPHTASLRQVLDALRLHQGRLVDARHGIGDPIPAEQLSRHAVALLAIEHALADRVLASRWVNVGDAVTYGATIDEVVTAMDLTVVEVAAGLRSWADGQRQFGHITDAEHDQVIALLDDGDR